MNSESEEEKICPRGKCDGSGVIEIMGDGENFEWDVIATRPCECSFED